LALLLAFSSNGIEIMNLALRLLGLVYLAC